MLIIYIRGIDARLVSTQRPWLRWNKVPILFISCSLQPPWVCLTTHGPSLPSLTLKVTCCQSIDIVLSNDLMTLICKNPLFQTLTGKEIEIDIEPTDKVKYDVRRTGARFLSCVDCKSLLNFYSNEGGAHKGKGGGERRHPSAAAKTHLQWKTDVSVPIHSSTLPFCGLFNTHSLCFPRNDEKTAADYKIQGGSVLHLVLALRGGSSPHRYSIHPPSSSWAAATVGGATWVPLL